MVHESLKSGKGVSKAERHYQELVVSLVCSEGYFMAVIRVHYDLVVSGGKA